MPREGAFNVNGLRNTANSFQLDGVDNNAYGTSNQGFSNQVIQVSPDAVAEFKVQTNNYSAEYGRSGGAVINASYRSGTNEFRGSAWAFNRNTALNATGFFKPTGGAKPSLKRNQFGTVFGGPLMRDRASCCWRRAAATTGSGSTSRSAISSPSAIRARTGCSRPRRSRG